MEVATRQVGKLTAHDKTHSSPRARHPKPKHLSEKRKAHIREIGRRLTQSYMLKHEPWSGLHLSAEYIHSPFSSPPVLFFGIGFKTTVEDLLPLSHSLDAPKPYDESHRDYVEGLFMGIWSTVRTKFEPQSNWPLMTREVRSSEADRVITLEDNKLRFLMGSSPTDDPNCWDSLDWRPLEGAAQKLQEVTGRTSPSNREEVKSVVTLAFEQNKTLKEYMFEHEPWCDPRSYKQFPRINDINCDFPLLFFGIAFEDTDEDVLSVARTLESPCALAECYDGGVEYLLADVCETLSDKLHSSNEVKIRWPLQVWSVDSKSEAERIIIIADNTMPHKRLRHLKKVGKEASRLTGREPKWYIASSLHNDWDEGQFDLCRMTWVKR
ncbi:hypothetical protein CONPUDRAFT_157348 [Coniophora puteana RWD-64-598 SS2]|uniref:Uncharacterized protein n=1 Tax=Coniophora puteana (strain RWD-64-598) TaxID=741705 RepID=A0A5M3MER9_CONPW|nr:uncharacterized protein CONPUDRAFT_157348 [Coniophora puteana RWD-64-598 SS2]EIW77081.1 hypothetical protein CONPUDRAFT_157348 [Coniophora puteana RWD-64-598 SS2]